MKSGTMVEVIDPFQAALDSALPTVAAALDPSAVNEVFRHALPRVAGPNGRVSVRRIEVIRHKPNKRCVIAYDVRVKFAEVPWGHETLIGKIRAKRYGNEGYRLQDAIWQAGFQANAADGISVPEPIGVIPELRLWLQRRVNGANATAIFNAGGVPAVELGHRVAEAIHKLHQTPLVPERAHTIDDELRILHECLPRVLEVHPSWSRRVTQLLAACDRLGERLRNPSRVCGIHRDFYPAQVIVDGRRLWLLDFDLFCLGDPALDVGNFLAHIAEESFRRHGNFSDSVAAERALEERFVALAGEATRNAVRGYRLLTLVRHVYLSTQFPERAAFTDAFLSECERELGVKTIGMG